MYARYLIAAAPLAVFAAAAPALAGEDVRYAEVPEWVEPLDVEQAAVKGEELVLYDRQLRLEDGVVHRYSDVAYDLSSSEMLSKFGTLQLSWLPDKGDLTLHRLELRRGNEVIDLLAQGVKPEIIRREQQLEQRSLDGALTALIKMPGVKLGDVVRFAFTTTSRDQALEGQMQAIEGLIAEPARVGFGRIRMSWPENSGVRYSSFGNLDAERTITEGGYETLQVLLPIAKQDEMPEDAPGRYRIAPMLTAGSFDDWSAVAAVMAPHYKTAGTIEPGSSLAAEVARIQRTGSSDLERAALALQSVQDEINYLMNGMNGGNYLPQSPAETWELRYGDCKAKSMLLLSMLHEMGIEADAVLVNTDNGDAVSKWQPLPGAFNHVIVRARIDGEDYWLDGTGSGARLATIDEVPNFAYGLPIAESGSSLVKLEQRWPTMPDRLMRVTYDYSAGVDLPGLVEFDVETRGGLAGWMQAKEGEGDALTRIAHAQSYFENFIDAVFYDATFSFDRESGIGRMKARGIVLEPYTLERNTAVLPLYTASTNWELNPDRSRAAWRSIPYQIAGPMTKQHEVTYLLPEGANKAELRGEADLADQIVAGTRFSRDLEFAGNRVTVTDRASYIPAELGPDELPAAKAAMRSLASKDPSVRLTDPVRSWELTDTQLRARAGKLLDPANRLVALAKDNENMPAFRAYVHSMLRDYDAALADVDLALSRSSTADLFGLRSDILARMGRYAEAAEAASRAYALDSGVAKGMAYAMALSAAGDDAKALDILDTYDLSGDEGAGVAMVFADIAGNTDRADEAWEQLERLAADRPGDGSILNSQCWFMATWSYRIEDGSDLCDQAVRASDYSAAVLDSRALFYHRIGRDEDALRDIEAVLRKSPGMAASLYLRGIISTRSGNLAAGKSDIEQALRIEPTIASRYAKFGIEPTR